MTIDTLTTISAIAPTRHIALDGTSNFRDLGGYTGQDGRAVRWRRLFRSDHLAALSADDQALLLGLGLARVCDFRGVTERSELACALPGAQVHSLAIEPAVVQGMKSLMDAGQRLTAQDTMVLMEDTYRAFVLDNTPRFKQLFAHLLDNGEPLVFHCTAGKDRTGFAAALILQALGVSRALVMQDYLLSNDYFRLPLAVQNEPSALPQEALAVLWRVQQSFLEAAFEAVETDYGDLSGYLLQGLGIDATARRRLAELYLDT